MTPLWDPTSYTSSNGSPPEILRSSIPSRIESLEKHHENFMEDVNRVNGASEAKLATPKALEKDLLSPIRDVPAEVIASVFTFAILGSDDHVGEDEQKMFLHLCFFDTNFVAGSLPAGTS
ncbi:hypothetical protein BKA70DRAFT_1241159 [Coprinopsis sp. MPI-PUGE-AT-0042]|nr:hypothetical protein BKA70DRAFT_1241159 [Coprinopsis sp. MPI-PUGE-AT-0042]